MNLAYLITCLHSSTAVRPWPSSAGYSAQRASQTDRTRGIRLLMPCRGAQVDHLALLARHHGSPPADTRRMGRGTCSLTQMVGETSLNMGRHGGEGYKPPWGDRGVPQALEPPRTRRKLLTSRRHKRCSRSPLSSLSPRLRSRRSSPTAVSCRTRSTDRCSRDGLYVSTVLFPSVNAAWC